jgi:hypothetical protein
MKTSVNLDEIELHLRKIIQSNLVSYELPVSTIEKITSDLFMDIMQLLEAIEFDVMIRNGG